MGTVFRGLVPSVMALGPVRIVPFPVALTHCSGGGDPGESSGIVVDPTATAPTTSEGLLHTGPSNREDRKPRLFLLRGRRLALACCVLIVLGVVFVIVVTTVVAIEKSGDGDGDEGPEFFGWEQGDWV